MTYTGPVKISEHFSPAPEVTVVTVHDVSPAEDDSPDEPEGDRVTRVGRVRRVTYEGAVDEVRAWLGNYISPLTGLDLDLLTLWCAHTHFAETMYTTPRLVIDSPLPDAGKTTVLEHLQRLCLHPCQMSSVSSDAMLVRLLDKGMRTLLVDEAEKTLSPERKDADALFAILNSGYKRGNNRPVSVPGGNGGWDVVEMTTFAPLAMAGISPQLPDDTMSRTVTVMLLPDDEGLIEDSDWEFIEPDADAVALRLAGWAEAVAEHVQANRQPQLPDGCKGRAKEKWRPLKRVADAAGGRWPDVCTELIERDLEYRLHDREAGLMSQKPAIALVRDIIAVWPTDVTHWPTDEMAQTLADRYPDRWGSSDRYKNGLTAQRIGRYLGKQWHVRSVRQSHGSGKVGGYLHGDLYGLARRAGLVTSPPRETHPTHLTRQTRPEDPSSTVTPVTDDLFTASTDISGENPEDAEAIQTAKDILGAEVVG